MKKILALFAVLAAVLPAFSLNDYSETTFSVGAAFPYMRQDFKIQGLKSETLSGAGVNITYRHKKEDTALGFFINSDIYFPTKKTLNLTEGYLITTSYSDYDYFFGVDALSGIYAPVFKSSGIVIPLGAGIHLDSCTSKYSSKTTSLKETVFTLGAGAWVNCEINVNKTFGFFGGLKFSYDFYFRLKETGSSSASDSGNCNAWSIAPSLGVSFHI